MKIFVKDFHLNERMSIEEIMTNVGKKVWIYSFMTKGKRSSADKRLVNLLGIYKRSEDISKGFYIVFTQDGDNDPKTLEPKRYLQNLDVAGIGFQRSKGIDCRMYLKAFEE